MFQHEVLDILFLICVIGMWAILFYHSFLLITAYDFFLKSRARLQKYLKDFSDPPFVTVLIPAHNEEIVIERTLQAMLELDYPRDRIEIVPLNDNSSDRTGEILDRFASKYRRVRPVHIAPGVGGKGKSHALNLGLKQARGDVICVYDADNSPEPNALKYLVAELVSDPKLAVVCGKVRTQNRKKNLLTRFINLEFISHQWMVQGGRYHLHGIATIPGTNFVVWKKVLDYLGGWDTRALTEDTELSLQIQELGYRISFNPFSITWEQEPETVPVWFRQRLRWLQGNQYIVQKYFRPDRFKLKNVRVVLYMVLVYALLLWSLIISDLIFVGGVIGLLKVTVAGPLVLTWMMAFFLFVISICVTLTFEETSEFTLENIGIAVLMYFTYCQMWIVLSVWSMIAGLGNRKGRPFWSKTQRFHLQK
ncbi:MAG: glycosyltransferase family 2 protein [Candidatus Omnitrophota bacterium]